MELRSFLAVESLPKVSLWDTQLISIPLPDLLMKNQACIWDEECHVAFGVVERTAVIKEGWKHDPMAKKIIALAKEGKTQRFWLKGDMLFTKGDRLYVPTWGDLRRVILKECHDSKWVGHLGIKRTLPLIEKNKSRGLLEPLPTPKGPWESVSMDFFTCLLKSEGSGSIIVVVYRFSKYETYIAALPDVTADDTSKLFFKNMVKY
ncbi:putative nucleotidyltransferase, ribonuclease H [Tanacetum coccineum]